ncbi:hypothetical protein Cni_G19416 [Canna indica]|uniref:Uncharacterized protein n=1 Tax=Canna indica TaxID=4628 RepID=A0AAQ3KN50_9LILI|nr:hypothetical protein Cni_G19416 [Canna indica]
MDHSSRQWSWNYDDELRQPSLDYTEFRDYQDWHTLEDDIVQRKQPRLELAETEISELHDDEIFPSFIPWSSNFEHKYHRSHMLIKTDYLDSYESSPCYYRDQSLVSYAKPKLLNLFDPRSPGCPSTFPLLEWKDKEETEFDHASDYLAPTDIDHVSQNLCGASTTLYETKDRYGSDDVFNSLLRDNCETMLQDAISGCLDVSPPNWKTLLN